MSTESLVSRVLLAKQDEEIANALISDYLPFIKSEINKTIYQRMSDDHVSIGMMAFYEAITKYDESKGNFLSLASLLIKNRLIDEMRKEERHNQHISLDEGVYGEEEDITRLDQVESIEHNPQVNQRSQLTQEEIVEFSGQLHSFGLSFIDVANNSPKQDRSLNKCVAVLKAAIKHPEVLEDMVSSKKLPVKP